MIILIVAIFAIIYVSLPQGGQASHEVLANNSIGTVEKVTYGNSNAPTCIALITGIHPREKLSIEPEIAAAEQFAGDDVQIINYKVTVTDNPDDYEKGRANGESLVHDYVNPDVTQSNADVVIISHSHNPDYGVGFYVATPAMDTPSVDLAKRINSTSDFNYYPVTGNESYKSTSAVLVSKPIAEAGYPTLVYEIPEDISENDATAKTIELFKMVSQK